MDPSNPDTLPDDDEDRRAYRRYWLPKLPAGIAAEMRKDPAPWIGRPFRLTDEEIDVLLAKFAQSELLAGIPRSRAGDPGRLELFLKQVLPIQLEIHSGWAELRDTRTNYVVEVHWATHHWEKSKPVLGPSRIVVRPVEVGTMIGIPDLHAYMTAFWVQVRSVEKRKAMNRTAMAIAEPAAGRKPATGYYSDLLAEFEVLQIEGHPEPAKELARRRGNKNRSTIRTHLKRAKELREREGRNDEQ